MQMHGGLGEGSKDQGGLYMGVGGVPCGESRQRWVRDLVRHHGELWAGGTPFAPAGNWTRHLERRDGPRVSAAPQKPCLNSGLVRTAPGGGAGARSPEFWWWLKTLGLWRWARPQIWALPKGFYLLICRIGGVKATW